MDRRDNPRRGRARNNLTALLHQLEAGAEHRLRSGGAETDDNRRLHGAQLRFQPRAARLHFRRTRLLVDAPLATRLPLEVFYGVGDIHLIARDAGVGKRLVEQRARGPDKRLPLPVLLIARLLADEHHPRALRPCPEHDLCGGLIEIAPAAFVRGRAQHLQTCRLRHERRRGLLVVTGLAHRYSSFVRLPPSRCALRRTRKADTATASSGPPKGGHYEYDPAACTAQT